MKLTSKGRYAVTAILDLAFHSDTGPVSLAEISKRQNISLSYLEQLFTRLRKQNIVSSTRGPGGGYSLGRPADQIAVAEVIAAVDEIVTTGCASEGSCDDGDQCLAHELWVELSQQIHDFLHGISIQDLMDEASIQQVAERQDSELNSGSGIHVTPPTERT
jgi:Rrf2 family iron-sulfur cluster assembly transcriptional regulator